MKRIHFRLGFPVCLFITGIALIGCEINSGNDTVRNVSVRIAGTYRNESGIPLRQSGAQTTRLTLTQSGDQLYGVDEHNIRWSGRITRAESPSFATLILNGRTTAGTEVTLSSEVRIDGTTARMSGLWIEPGNTSGFSAEATVTPAPSPEPTPTPQPGATPTPTPGNNGTQAPVITIGN